MKILHHILSIVVFLCVNNSFCRPLHAEDTNDEYQKIKLLRNDKSIDQHSFRNHPKHNKSMDRNGKYKRPKHYPRLNKFMESLSDEEKEELRELRQKNPKEFRKKMKQTIHKMRKSKHSNSEADKGLKKLVKKYQTAKNDDQKEKIKSKIREITVQQFEAKMTANQQELERIEQRVKELRDKYELRKKKMDEIIENRVNSLTKNSELEW